MGVTYWAYAWVSKNARASLPKEYKEELKYREWREVKNNEEGIWWKLTCSVSSPYFMGFYNETSSIFDWGIENAQDFQCIFIDDSGYGGVKSNPEIGVQTNDLVRWKTFTDAELEFHQITQSE